MASARVNVRLTPRAGRDCIERVEDGTVHARVRPAPADGAANAALVALVADALDVPKTSVAIAAGHRSRTKVVEISAMETDAALARLAAKVERASGKRGSASA